MPQDGPVHTVVPGALRWQLARRCIWFGPALLARVAGSGTLGAQELAPHSPPLSWLRCSGGVACGGGCRFVRSAGAMRFCFDCRRQQWQLLAARSCEAYAELCDAQRCRACVVRKTALTPNGLCIIARRLKSASCLCGGHAWRTRPCRAARSTLPARVSSAACAFNALPRWYRLDGMHAALCMPCCGAGTALFFVRAACLPAGARSCGCKLCCTCAAVRPASEPRVAAPTTLFFALATTDAAVASDPFHHAASATTPAVLWARRSTHTDERFV